jgi:hypothetical protein
MYATIRRYTPKSGAFEPKAINDLKRRIEERFAPTLQEIRGFHSYYVVSAGPKELLSIGVFEDKAGATESTRKAAEFVKNDPMKDLLATPEVREGEVLVQKEATVGAR